MTRMKKIVSLFLASALLVLPLAATGGMEETSATAAYAAAPTSGLLFDYSVDTNQVFRYEKATIPVEFDILGLPEDDTATLSVSSTMAVSYPAQRTAAAYSNKNRHVEMDISFTPNASKQLNATKATVEEISLTVTSSDQTVPTQTLVLYVLPTPHGYFVSYVGEQIVREYYEEWKFENGMITQEAYKAIVRQRGLMKDVDEQTYLAAVTSKGGLRTPQDTSMFADYAITVNGINVTVTGTLYWIDRGGASHAAQDVRVDIMDEEDGTLEDELLVTTYTSETGIFSASFINQTGSSEGGCDVYIKFLPSSADVVVKNQDGGEYSVKTATEHDLEESIAMKRKNIEPEYATRAFQIHQAARIGAKYVKTMSGSSLAQSTYRYPFSDTSSTQGDRFNISGGYIEIRSSTYPSWDVILHEYGHYTQVKKGIYNNSGGTHFITRNMIDVYFNGNADYGISPAVSLMDAKTRGTNIAWSEGWATYFSLAAQARFNIAAMNIPGAGDTAYDDLRINQFWDCGIGDSGCGEGNELAVTRILWDMADDPNDQSIWGGSTSEAHDNVALGHQMIWNYSMSAGNSTLSAFMQYVFQRLSVGNQRNVGRILGAENVAVNTLKTNGSTALEVSVAAGTVPVFTWTNASGSEECLDDLTVEIYDLSMNLITYVTVTTPSDRTICAYTMSAAMWETVKTYGGTGFYWCVRTNNSFLPITGPYYSQFIRCNITQ